MMKAIRILVCINTLLYYFFSSAAPVFAQEGAGQDPDISYLLVSAEGGARADLRASGNMGSLVFPVPLEVPPARGGTQPTLVLVYNSENQRHGGWVGNGWSLDLGYIERSLKDGVPSYSNDDKFIIKLGKASGELVLVATSGNIREYRMEIENLFLRIFFFPSSNSWLAIDKQGTEYTFGAVDSSRIFSETRVFRWALEKIENKQFNHVTSITYMQTAAGQIYPQAVDYFHGRVEFVLGDHPQPFTSFKYGFLNRVDKILVAVKTYFRTETGQFEPAAVYGLEYTNQYCAVDLDDEPTCFTPLLSKITRFNADSTQSLPPTVFTYTDASLTAAQSALPQWAFPLIDNGGFTESDGEGDNGVRLEDINNDGFPDILQADGDDQRKTFLNNQFNGWSDVTAWPFPVIDNGGFTEDDGTGDNGVRLADVNQDGFVDILQADGDSLAQHITFLNNGVNGWDQTLEWQVPVLGNGGFTDTDGDGDNGVRLADVNGDGRVDLLQADGTQRQTFLNNGVNGWDQTSDWQVPLIDNGGFTENDGDGDNGVRLADVNGDGRVDLLQADGTQRQTFLNNGVNGWDQTSDWEMPAIDNGGFTENDGDGDNGVRAEDINHDGFADILQADGADQRKTFLNNHLNGWSNAPGQEFPVIDNGGLTENDGMGDNGVRLADVDHDGDVDILQADGDSLAQHVTFLNDGSGRWALVTIPTSALELEKNWQLTSAWELPLLDGGGFTENDGDGDNGVRFDDVNADGYIDILQADGDESGQHLTFLNNGINGWEGTARWQFPIIDGGFTENDGSSDNSIQLADVDGDGFVDILQADGSDLGQHRTYRNNGVDGWKFTPDWEVPRIDDGGFTESDGDGDNGVRLADVNGDGYVDIVQADDVDQRATFLNDGRNGWDQVCCSPTLPNLWEFPVVNAAGFTENGGEEDNGVRFVDVNGDGLVDIVQADGSDQRETFLNNGVTGWESTKDWQVPVIDNGGFTENEGTGDNGVRLTDLNFDGFVDIVQAEGNSQRKVFLNNGANGWVEVKSWQLPVLGQGGLTEEDGEGDNGVRLLDLNGDGFVDLLQADGLLERRSYLNGITQPPLLTKVDNGIGGISEINYQTRTGKPIIYTVSKITDLDGFRTTSVEYQFAGPYFDLEDDEFRGFHSSRIISDQSIIETYYHQGDGDDAATFETDDHFSKQGLAYFIRVLRKENPALFYQVQRNTWGRQQSAPGSNFVFLDTEIIYEFDTDGFENIAKASNYDYDDFGNLIEVEKHNYVTDHELDGVFVDTLDSDNLVTKTEYALDDPADPKLRAFPSRITVEDFDGRILKETRFFYDDLDYGNVSLGRLTREQRLRVYDELGNYPTDFITNTDPASTDDTPTMIEVATYEYDSFGNAIARTNPNGDRKTYGYDPTNQYVVEDQLTVTKGKSAPVNILTQFKYDYRFGSMIETIAPNGAIQQWEYDDFGRLLVTKQSDATDVNTVNLKEQYSYHLDGATGGISRNVTERVSASGTVQERKLVYMDGFLRTVQTKDLRTSNGSAVFATQDTRYASNGQIETSSQPYFTPASFFTPANDLLPHVRSKYDGLGRLIATIPVNMAAEGSPLIGERFEFIVQDSQQGKILRKGDQETRYLVDANQQITDIFQTNGEEVYHTSYAYDVLDRLVQIKDHAGNRIELRYDSFDRKREMQDPDIGLAQYFYDNAGNIVRFIDSRQNTTLFEYDELFRILSKAYPKEAAETISYRYDENGDTGYLTSIESKNVTSLVDYDALGRVIRQDREIDNDLYTISMAYDSLGRITSMVYPDQDTVSYEYYDSGGQLFRVRLGTTTLAEFQEYSPVDKALRFSFGNGTSTTNDYFPSALRLKESSVVEASGKVLQGFSFEYNDFGNVSALREEVTGSIKRFAYDDLNRLTSFSYQPKQDESLVVDNYAYDAIGNIVEKEGKAYKYDADRPHIPLSLGARVLKFDAAGNQTRGLSGNRYTYDLNNRLVQAFDGSNNSLAKYFYDSSTGLVKKQTRAGKTIYIDRLYELNFGRNKATKYIYAHQSLIAAQETAIPRQWAKGGESGIVLSSVNLNQAGSAASLLSLLLLCAYVFLHRGQPSTGRSATLRYRLLSCVVISSAPFSLLSVPLAAGPRLIFFHTDHLGSVTLLTDQTGAEVRRIEYRPFGEILETSGSVKTPYQFTGQLADDDIGLYYYQSRFYDPGMGRFIQPDIFIPDAADPQHLNRFNYVNNNPINLVDPTGHWFGWDDLIVAGIGFAVGFGLALLGGADFETALAAGLSSALSSWLAYNTFGAAGLSFQLGAQLTATVSNKVFEGNRGGLAGDIVQLITTYAASPIVSTVGLLVGVSYIAFTDRTWSNDFHFFDGTLWFRDPFRGKAAMTTGVVIHYEDETVYNEETIKHELIHRRQFGFTGDGFVGIYFAEIGIRMLFGQNQDDAYESQLFEAEAYANESPHGFLGPGSSQEAFQNIRLFDQNLLISAPGRF